MSAPKLLFLNPGLDACLANALARPWEPHKYASREQQDANPRFLLSWIEDDYTCTGPMSLAGHRECFASYNGPKRALGQSARSACTGSVRPARAAGTTAASSPAPSSTAAPAARLAASAGPMP